MKGEDIDKRIERVVKSVASKKAEMAQWERERKSSEIGRAVASKRWRIYGIAAAASVIVICVLGIGAYMTLLDNADFCVTSSAPMYRGGSADISEITAMIESKRYEDALQAIEATMADTVIDPTFSEERKEYLRSLNRNQGYELTWLNIQVHVKLDKKKEAIKLLEEYVLTDGSHQTEAQELLNKLKE